MEQFHVNLPLSPEQRLMRFLLLVSVLMVASAYLYRWTVTDRHYDIPHDAPRIPVLADSPTTGSAQ